MKSKKKIENLIEEKGIKKQYIAYQLNIRPETLSKKIKHPEKFVAKEMAQLSKVLETEITDIDFGVIFFSD